MSDRHDPSQRRAIWPPSPGFFRMRLVRKAWEVPARIVFDDGRWYAVVDEAKHEAHADPVHAPMVSVIWHGGTMIPESEYDWRIAVKRAARAANDEFHPALNPTKPINHMRLRPL